VVDSVVMSMFSFMRFSFLMGGISLCAVYFLQNYSQQSYP